MQKVKIQVERDGVLFPGDARWAGTPSREPDGDMTIHWNDLGNDRQNAVDHTRMKSDP